MIAGLAAPVCGLVLTWATNPIARLGTVHWLRDSIDIARKYPWDVGPIRAAGQDLHSVDLPWWYVPAWLWAQLPLLTFAALVGGIAVVVTRLIWPRRAAHRARRRSRWCRSRCRGSCCRWRSSRAARCSTTGSATSSS